MADQDGAPLEALNAGLDRWITALSTVHREGLIVDVDDDHAMDLGEGLEETIGLYVG